MIGKYFHFVSNKLRVNTAWRYKVPVLITIPYIVILVANINAVTAFKYILLSFITIIGIACYAFLLNDWADIEKDLAAGKANAVAALSNTTRVGLFMLFLALAITPWFFFPFTRFTISLLILELALFAAYSFPPVRLKEKPIAGIVTDTLYAHVIPCLLAALTFFTIAAEKQSYPVAGLSNFSVAVILYSICAWQFFLGMRNILLHQIEDADNDLISGTITLATTYGVNTIRPLLILTLLLEVVTFIVFLFTLGYIGIFIAATYFLYSATLITRHKGDMLKVEVRTAAYRFLDDFYYQWLALPVLGWLCFIDIRFTLLAIMHIILFGNALKNMLSRLLSL